MRFPLHFRRAWLWFIPLVLLGVALHGRVLGGQVAGFESPPERLAGGAWLLRWSTEPGAEYRLERSVDLSRWEAVTNLRADGVHLEFTDPSVPLGAAKAFWRVVRLGAADTTPPTVSILQVRRVAGDGESSLELMVQAEDNVGVVGVSFSGGAIQLGAATEGPEGTWKRIVPLHPDDPAPRQFQARAADAAGNAGFSEIYTLIPGIQGSDLVPLDAEGNAAGDSLVGQRPDGTLYPFSYLPDYNGGASASHAFRIDFPEGGRIAETADGTFFSGARVRVGFGPDSPTQLLNADGVPGFQEVAAADASLRIRRGELSFADLASLLRLPAGGGIRLRLHGKSEILWKGGVLTRHGIRGGIFRLVSPALGLPADFGGYEREYTPLDLPSPVGFSVRGALPLGQLGRLEIPLARPLTLLLHPGGEVTLRGSGDLFLRDGSRFHADILLDDPVYALSLRAGNLEIPLIGSLADLLPADPAACVPAADSEAALNQATDCLRAHERAYRLFLGASRSLRPDAPADAALASVPASADLAAAALEAWMSLARVNLAVAPPSSVLSGSVATLRDRMRGGASHPVATIEAAAILRRLSDRMKAIQQDAVANDLNESILAAKPSLLRALEHPDALQREVLHDLVLVLVSMPFEFDPELAAAAENLLRRAIRREAEAIGVLPGVFVPDANPTLRALNPYAAFAVIRRLGDIGAAAQAGRIDATQLPLYEEIHQQVFAHAAQAVMASVDRHLADRNPFAVLTVLGELADLQAMAELLPFAIAALPGVERLEDLLAKASSLVEQAAGIAEPADPANPVSREEVFSLVRRFNGILDVAARLPSGEPSIAPTAQRLLAQLDAILPAVTAAVAIAAEDDEQALVQSIRALFLHQELRQRFPSRPVVFDGFASALGQLADRIAAIAITTGDSKLLLETSVLVLHGADQLEFGAQRPQADAVTIRGYRRKALLAAATLLGNVHPLAVIDWSIAESRRAADPATFATDALLPGNLMVDQLAGTVRYNRITGASRGRFSGSLRLPKMESALTIQRASLDSGGSIDIAASGSLRFPGAPETAAARLEVPPGQPLHFALAQGQPPRISGRARLAFDNGTSLAVGLRFDDPVYTFQAEVGSLDTGLRDAMLAVASPSLGSVDATIDWLSHYDQFSSWLESRFAAPQAADESAADDFPGFSEQPPFDAPALLEAWLDRAIAEAREGSDDFIRTTDDPFARFIEFYSRGIQTLADAFVDFFTPASDRVARDALKRLAESARLQRKLAQLLEVLAVNDLSGGPHLDAALLNGLLRDATVQFNRAADAISGDAALLRRPELVRTAARAGFDLAGAVALTGGNEAALPGKARDLLRRGMEEYLLSRGLLSGGQVIASVVNALDGPAVEETLREFFQFHGELMLAGEQDGPQEAHIRALAARLSAMALGDLALLSPSGAGGAVSDAALLGTLRHLGVVYAEINPLLTEPLPLPPDFTGILARLHGEFLARAAALRQDDWAGRGPLLAACARCRELRVGFGGGSIDPFVAEVFEGTALTALVASAGPRFTDTEVSVLRGFAPRRNAVHVAGKYRERLLLAAQGIRQEATGPWTAAQLPLAETLLAEIALLDELADPAMAFPAGAAPSELLAMVRQRVAEAAPPARRARIPAVLARIAARAAAPDAETLQIRAALGPNAVAIKDAIDPAGIPARTSPALAAAMKQESAAFLNVSRSAIGVMAAAPRPPAEPDLALPGDLRIERAFGGFYFDRSNGFLRGRFGGRLLFPDPRATFEIIEATFDNRGGFSISAATTTPVKVADHDRATLRATLAVAGNAQGLQSVGGTGTLTIPAGPDADRSYTGTFSYEPSQPGKPLVFTAAVAGVQNEFAVGRDFALFDGSLSLAFSTERPDAELRFAGKAGFFARPDPPAGSGRDGQYWVVCEIGQLSLGIADDRLRATFSGGSLRLAGDIFFREEAGRRAPATIALTGTLGVDIPLHTGLPSFFGNNDPAEPFRAAATDFRFRVPGIADSLITVRNATLEFFQNRLPVLASLDASFRFPLPGLRPENPAERVPEFGLNVLNWGVDGFPPQTTAVTLRNGLSLIDLEGLDVDLLGQSESGIPPVSLTFRRLAAAGGPVTRMELAGGLRVGIENGLIQPKPGTTPTSPQQLSVVPGSMRAAAVGSFGWTFAPGELPSLELEEIIMEGSFLLGGSLEISGVGSSRATLRIRGFRDLFVRSTPADPLSINLTASVAFKDIGGFALNGARFVWRNPASALPDFDLAGAGLVLGDSLSTLLSEDLPIYVKSLALNFLDASRPLIGSPGRPGRFAADNMELMVTAGAEFPPSPPIDVSDPAKLPPSGPRFGGEITNLRITYPDGNPLLPQFSLDAVRMGITGLDVPPLKGLSGQVALLNLDQLRSNPPRPDRVTFAGELKADFNGTGVGVLMAASPSALHGAGLTASVPGGIPLDGGVLGGILWNGASGGLHFLNSFADPTEFATYLQRDNAGNFTGADEFPPPGTTGQNPAGISDPFDEIKAGDEFYIKPEMETPPGQSFDEFDVLRDNWPPRAANPLLEEFPAGSGRLVFRGSRKSAAEADAFLDGIGIRPDDNRTAEAIIGVFIDALTRDVRATGEAAVRALLAASGQQNNQGVVALYRETTEKLIASFDDVVRPILRGILQPVGLAGGPPVRQQMHGLLTSGVPGFNVTFLGSGTFTHTAVAPVLDLKGTISASTTGAALSRGELRLAGIPVAEASLGVSLTNEAGRISPFMGGLARVGIGPLEFGKITMAASLPDAASVAGHFDAFVRSAAGTLSNGAAAHFRLLAENAAGAAVPAGTSLESFLLARSPQQKLGIMGALFDFFARSAEGTLSQQFVLAEADFRSLASAFAVLVADTLNSLTPELAFGGKVAPSVFGIPMTSSGMPLASARMRYGPVLRPAVGEESLIGLMGQPLANRADAAPAGVREFSAYGQFSPAAVILSPITGTFLAANPLSAPLVGFSAVDSAELGFSFQIASWTPEKVLTFLTNPVQFQADRTREFFDTAVFAAGYRMSPFGMTLADAQLRLVFPDTQLHPRRPGGSNAARLGNPIRPVNSDGQRTAPLPTTEEVILAALTAGRIKDATFRGSPGELDDLFPVPSATPPQDGNLARLHRISAELRALDPDLAQLAAKSFPKDYFPYGGIIGGGQLALPKLLTRGLPPDWGLLFSTSGQEWLRNFESVLAFLSSTDSVGQLACYLPAPNPVLFPGESATSVWAGMTIDQLLARLQMDPAALIDRSINPNLYELGEIVLAGWAQADLLGIPLGDARIAYNGTSRRLEAVARISPDTPGDGNWFNDFVTGKASFAIQLPSDQQNGLVTWGAADLFRHIQENFADIRALSGPALDDRIAQLQNSLKGSLPRISAEIDSGVTLPPGFGEFVRGSGQLSFFAYSPYFEPGFEPSNDRPRAVARRQGGLGISGALQLGYFSPDGDPGNDVFVNVSNASLALSVPTGAGLPGLSGNFEISGASLPVPVGGLGSASLQNLRLTINTDPAIGQNYLRFAGVVPPVNLGGFLRVQPTAGASIGGEFIVTRTANPVAPSAGLTLRPARITFPGLIEGDFNLRIHGTSGEASDFTLTTSGDFGAALTLRGGMTLRDPFNNAALLTLRGPDTPISGTLSRSGGVLQTSFSLPPGFSAEFHPLGQRYTFATSASLVLRSDGTFDIRIESPDALEVPDFFRIGPPPGGVSQLVLSRSGNGIAKLRIAAPQLTLFPGANGLRKPTFALPDFIEIESTGRFYVNVGPRSIDLFGAVSAEGHLEFGYEPSAPNATHAFTKSATSRNFSSQPRGRAVALPLTITNTGTAALPLALELSGTGAANYHLSQSGMQLAPAQSRAVTITFIAKGNANPASLTIRPLHGLAPAQTVALSGATASPLTLLGDLVRSEAVIDFGQLATGLTEGRTALLMNTGTETIAVNSVTAPAGVSIQGEVTGPLAPGETRVVPLVYRPAAAGPTSGSLNYSTTPGTTSANLGGTVVNRAFLRVHQSTRPFVSLSMSGSFGTATDVDGKVWRTVNQGATWKPEVIPSLPANPGLQPRILAATSGGNEFRWLVGQGGEFWQAAPGSAWSRATKPQFTDPTRNWLAIARHSNAGTPLALVAGNQGSTGIILRETAPGSFAELTFAGSTLRGLATQTADQTALAIGDAGKLFRSVNGGAAFSAVSVAGTSAALLSADISASLGSSGKRTAVIGAAKGLIFRSNDSGTSWSPATVSAPGFSLGDIVSIAIDGNRALAVDDHGILLSSADAGITWTAGEQGFSRSPINALARSGSDFWALTANGEIHYRIPDGGLLTPPLTMADDELDLGLIPTTTPGPHFRSTAITNAGNAALSLTLTPSGSGISVSPATATLAPGQSLGVRIGLTTGSSPGTVSGGVSITAAGFSKGHELGIRGKIQNRTWAKVAPFTTSDLVDVETLNDQTRHALSATHFHQTLNRGASWTERPLPAGANRAMFFNSSTTGVVVGGSSSTGRIYRTTDSGATWSTVYSENRTTLAAGRAVTDVHIRTTNVGYAVTSSATTLLGALVPGRILRTADGGATWTPFNGPPDDPDFSATSVHAVSDSRAFVTAGSTIYAFDTTIPGWVAIRSFGGSALRRIRFAPDNTTGWAVGANSLFAVTTTGGATAASWGTFLELFPTGGSFDDLCFDVAGQARAILNRTDSMQIWQQGATGNDPWSADAFPFAAGSTTPRPRAIDMSSAGAQGTAVGDGGAVWFYNATPAVLPDRAIAAAPELDFGILREAAGPETLSVTVFNPTAGTVTITDAIIDPLGTGGSFSTAFAGGTIAANGSLAIPVTFAGLLPGNHEGMLTLLTDSHAALPTRIRLTAAIQAEPAGLVVRTNPPSLVLTAGSSSTSATASRVVRDGPAAAGELTNGQSLALTAAPLQAVSGVTYKFANWTGGAGGSGDSISHPAGNTSRFLEAIYRPFFGLTPLTTPEAAAPTGGSAPVSRPSAGAWIRLTGARLRVPALQDFMVSGEMFLSGTAIRASMAATSFQLPSDSAPILDAGAGSWTLDWQKNGPFRFAATSPSLKVFNSDLLPSAATQISFQNNGDFAFEVSLPDAFQDVTGLFEIAPSGNEPAQLGFAFQNNLLSFSLKGRLRALNNGGNGWLVDQPVAVSNSSRIFPLSLPLPTLDLGAFRITSGSLNLDRNQTTGVIQLALDKVSLTGPLGSISGLSSKLDSTGTATFSHSGSLSIGPFQLNPVTPGSVTAISLNGLTGRFSVAIPPAFLDARSGEPFADRWPKQTVALPSFSCDSSGAFDLVINLPTLAIDGIALSGGGATETNFVRFQNSRSGRTTLTVRDRQDFFGNVSDLEFTVSSNGGLSGRYYGEMSFFGLQLGMVRMAYNPAEKDYQFQGTFRVLGDPNLTISCGYGSAGGFFR